MEKASKKGLSLLIDQLIKCFQFFSIKFILLFYDKRSAPNPFQIKYNFLYFFFSKKRLKIVLFMKLKNSMIRN